MTLVVGTLKAELPELAPGPTTSDTTLAPPPEKLCPLELPELLEELEEELLEPLELAEPLELLELLELLLELLPEELVPLDAL